MQEGIRINKYLSDAGICSRREADRQIQQGNVLIDGVPAENGSRVQAGQSVIFCGKLVEPEQKKVLLAFYKPVGIVCTTQKREKDNIIDYINYPQRIYPVGRLDKDSEGLILLTNDGSLVNKIMRAGNRHEKVYLVDVYQDITKEFLNGMAGGVYLKDLDVTTRKCRVKKLQRRKFQITLTQGYNRQIRRMCEAFGYRVRHLKRIRILNITLGDLKPGEYREITGDEYDKLMKLIRNSSQTTVITERKNKGSTD